LYAPTIHISTKNTGTTTTISRMIKALTIGILSLLPNS
jgi:hypothetical protein